MSNLEKCLCALCLLLAIAILCLVAIPKTTGQSMVHQWKAESAILAAAESAYRAHRDGATPEEVKQSAITSGRLVFNTELHLDDAIAQLEISLDAMEDLGLMNSTYREGLATLKAAAKEQPAKLIDDSNR